MVMISSSRIQSLVSVIITGSNDLRNFRKTIDSIITQSWSSYEIIVIDYGIIDIKEQVEDCKTALKYFHIPGASISRARNHGIGVSCGHYLVFLDASDQLVLDALQINAQYLERNYSTAFVSGAHKKVNEIDNIIEAGRNIVLDNHYQHLL